MKEIVWNIEALRDIALDQYGYVTTQQALDAGVTKPTLSKLMKRDRLERVAHGVYRVPQVAPTTRDRYMLALLWTGAPEAVLSHETALDAYEVSDINPTTIHVTVDKSRRIRREGGQGYKLHYETLQKDQIGWWEEIPTVKLATAIWQCIEMGTPSYLIDQAIENGRKQGRLLQREVESLTKEIKNRDNG